MGSDTEGYVDIYLLAVPEKDLVAYRGQAMTFGEVAKENRALGYRDFRAIRRLPDVRACLIADVPGARVEQHPGSPRTCRQLGASGRPKSGRKPSVVQSRARFARRRSWLDDPNPYRSWRST